MNHRLSIGGERRIRKRTEKLGNPRDHELQKSRNMFLEGGVHRAKCNSKVHPLKDWTLPVWRSWWRGGGEVRVGEA